MKLCTIVIHPNSRVLYVRKDCQGLSLKEAETTLKTLTKGVKRLFPRVSVEETKAPVIITHSIVQVAIIFNNPVYSYFTESLQQKLSQTYRWVSV
jgi:hypothetical protein